jgi:outer membrane protein OmpA-like peptidoglycan-associated protein
MLICADTYNVARKLILMLVMSIYSYLVRIKRKFKEGAVSDILCIVSLVFLFAVLPCISFGDDGGFTVFKVQFDSAAANKGNSAPVKDFYINGGKEDGLTTSTVLDVYRDKIARDYDNGEDYKIRIPVGKIKAFKVYKNVSLTRIISLKSSSDSPVLKYRTVMIGDYAVPRKKQLAKKESKIAPASNITATPSGEGILIPSKVLFKINDWQLKPEAKDVLSTVHDEYKKAKDKYISIKGYTCSLGSDKYNNGLSQKRAQSVSDYLINNMGISKDNIQIKYYGEKDPVALNDMEAGRVKNRRVEIHFLPRDKTASLK